MTDKDLCDREQYILELEASMARLEQENKRLQKIEEKFTKAFYKNQIPMAITRIKDGCFLDFNDKFLLLYGCKREDVETTGTLNLDYWENAKDRVEMIDLVNRDGYISNFESTFRNKCGQIGVLRSSVSVLELDGEGCILISSEDITDRKKLEQALRVSAEKFSKAFYESGAMKAIARCRDGVLIDVNDSYASTFGFARDEMIGKTALELAIWAEPSEGQKMREQLGKEGFIRDWEYNYKTNSGAIGTVISNVDLINVDDEPCILVSSNNITRRKKAEEELISTQMLLNRVFNSTPHSMIIISMADGKLVEANEEFLTRNRLTREEAIGNKHIFQSYVENPDVIDKCFEVFKRDGYLINCEASLKSIPRGEVQTVLLNAVAIEWAGQDCALVVSNNITELRRYQNEISRLDSLNLIGQMAAGVAHEIRNPMTSIKGFLQMFQEQNKYREDREAIELMLEELDRVNDIITDFLTISQKNHIEIKSMNLNECISGVLQLIIADALKNDVFLDTQLEHTPEIMSDKGELKQLLLNLTRNAIEAMPSGGTLTVHTFEDASGVNLVVRDEGNGIPPEILDKIGTPFLTTKENGTGLGLGVCYSIAERHNARITVDTSSEGTSFKVTFPVVDKTIAQ